METRRRNVAGPPDRGFASFELLIAIALSAVLVALLMPVMGKARAMSRERRCAQELRRVGAALALYAADHDGRYPPAVVNGADGSVTDIWASLALAGRDRPHCPAAGGAGVPYALNAGLAGAEATSVRTPGLTVLVCDARVGIVALGGPDTGGALQRLSTVAPLPDLAASEPPGATRHRGAANYLFVDGHVRRLAPEDAAFVP